VTVKNRYMNQIPLGRSLGIFFSFSYFILFWLTDCYWGLNLGSTRWATSPDLFCEGFFKKGSHGLFARDGF
jgi:hypothetical protein